MPTSIRTIYSKLSPEAQSLLLKIARMLLEEDQGQKNDQKNTDNNHLS